MLNKLCTSKAFIVPFAISLVLSSVFVVWQLGLLSSIVYSLPRPSPSTTEYIFGSLLVLLLSVNFGLFNYQKRFGSCPIGTKRASGVASILGVAALICPACVLLPFSLFGMSLILSSFSVYIPMLQIISIFVLIVSMLLLWPKKN